MSVFLPCTDARIPRFYIHPVDGPSPQFSDAGENHFLHVNLTTSGREAAEIGLTTRPERALPRVPIYKYVRVPFSPSGLADQRFVQVSPVVQLTPGDFKVFYDFADVMGIRSRNYSDVISGREFFEVEPAKPPEFEFPFQHDEDEILSFRTTNSMLALAALRVLALHRMVTLS